MKKMHLCLGIFVGLTSFSAYADPCNQALHPFKPEELAAGKILSQKFPDLHRSSAVEAKMQMKDRSGLPSEKLARWLRSIEQVSQRASSNPEVLARVKAFYFQKNVIPLNEIPQSFYDFQVKLAREQGHGTIVLTSQQKEELAKTIIKDQEKSLETWIDYFLSNDSSYIPTWAKVWSFNGLLKLAKFDPELGVFGKRSAGQVAPFPELNREALALVIDSVTKEKVAAESLNFGKLYGQELKNLKNVKIDHSVIDGKWVKYPQGSDPAPLVKSLEGMNTGWCTAGKTTAETQLANGDFHVFYSNDDAGVARIPRIAIRMKGNSIGEVRGVAKDQNLDPQITDANVLENKLKEFGSEADLYRKKTKDMKRLTEIEQKQKANLKLSKADLKFLYEVDEAINGFGYEEDPRIEEIIQQRNMRDDLALVTGFQPHEISLTDEEALKGGIRYHRGNLNLNGLQTVEGLVLPQSIGGDLNLSSLQTAEGLVLPQSVGGNLDLRSLQSAEGLVLPQTIGGNLYLSGLESAKDLVLPQTIGGGLDLNGLQSAKDLVLPQTIGGDLYLRGLQSAKGLVLPQTIGGDLYLRGLQSAKGLVLPHSVGKLVLSGVQSAEGLILPQSVGILFLDGLQSAEGLILPQSVDVLHLNGLQSAKGLVLPQSVRRLFLGGLQSKKDLVLPKSFKGRLIAP